MTKYDYYQIKLVSLHIQNFVLNNKFNYKYKDKLKEKYINYSFDLTVYQN